jgi:hypothetical protein
MMEGLKRGSAAIVGVAESDLGQVADDTSVFDLMAQGVGRALDGMNGLNGVSYGMISRTDACLRPTLRCVLP